MTDHVATILPEPIEITPHFSETPISFDTLESIRGFAEQELKFTYELKEIYEPAKATIQNALAPSVKNQWEAFLHYPEVIIGQVERYPSGGEERAIQDGFERLRGALFDYQTSDLLYSATPESQYLRAIAKEDLSGAIAFFYVLFHDSFNGFQPNNQHHLMLHAQEVHGHFYKIILRTRTTGALSEVAAQGLEVAKEATSIIGRVRSELSKALADVETQRNALKQQCATALAEHGKEHKALRDHWESELDNVKRTYEEYMGLSAPVEYWKKKKKNNLWWMVGSGVVFVLLSCVIIYALATHFEQWKTGWPIGKDIGTPYFHILSFATVAFLTIWVMRLIARLFITNLHGYIDAEERAVMTNVFLSLMNNENKVSENDRILILQALFRPSAALGRGDDGAPPHWFDVLTSKIKPGE